MRRMAENGPSENTREMPERTGRDALKNGGMVRVQSVPRTATSDVVRTAMNARFTAIAANVPMTTVPHVRRVAAGVTRATRGNTKIEGHSREITDAEEIFPVPSSASTIPAVANASDSPVCHGKYSLAFGALKS